MHDIKADRDRCFDALEDIAFSVHGVTLLVTSALLD